MLASVAALALVIATQNVQQGLPPAQAHHDIRQAAAHSSVLMTQEMGLRDARRFAPAGWGTAHFPGLRRGDCATYWQRSSWRRISARTVRLTDAPFRAGRRFALVVILAGQVAPVATVCVHMITDWRGRRPVYARGMVRLRALLAQLRTRWGHVVVGGDWNRRIDQRPWLPLMRARRPPWPTHSPGVRIDWLSWHGLAFRAVHDIGHTYSDHNGVRYAFG